MANELYKSDMVYKSNYLVSVKCRRTETILQVILTMHIQVKHAVTLHKFDNKHFYVPSKFKKNKDYPFCVLRRI